MLAGLVVDLVLQPEVGELLSAHDAVVHAALEVSVGWFYQLGGDNISVLSDFISLPADYQVPADIADNTTLRIYGGTTIKAHRLVYHSTLGSRVIKKKKKKKRRDKHPAMAQRPGSSEGGRVAAHPGGNPGANRWFLESTPIQMPPESGGICGRLT